MWVELKTNGAGVVSFPCLAPPDLEKNGFEKRSTKQKKSERAEYDQVEKYGAVVVSSLTFHPSNAFLCSAAKGFVYYWGPKEETLE